MSFQKMYGLRGPSGLNMVNQAFIIVIAYRPRRRRRRRRKIPGIGRYPMGPTNIQFSVSNINNHLVIDLVYPVGASISPPARSPPHKPNVP